MWADEDAMALATFKQHISKFERLPICMYCSITECLLILRQMMLWINLRNLLGRKLKKAI
jgi:hypothetical protein